MTITKFLHTLVRDEVSGIYFRFHDYLYKQTPDGLYHLHSLSNEWIKSLYRYPSEHAAIVPISLCEALRICKERHKLNYIPD